MRGRGRAFMAARSWDSLHDRPYRTRPSRYLRLTRIGHLQEVPRKGFCLYDQALRMRLPESGGDERKEDNAESTNQHGNHGNWNEYDCRSLSPTHAVSSHDEEDIE